MSKRTSQLNRAKNDMEGSEGKTSLLMLMRLWSIYLARNLLISTINKPVVLSYHNAEFRYRVSNVPRQYSSL